MLFRREIKRREDAAIDRNQMRRELDRYLRFCRERKLLLDFRQMPVLRHAVRPHAFVALAKKIIHFGFFPRAADAAQGIGYDSGWFDQTRL